jgi:hypothetical protein
LPGKRVGIIPIMLLTFLAVFLLGFVHAQSPIGDEYAWTFDTQNDLSVEISATVTIHTSGTWSWDGFDIGSNNIRSFHASEYVSGEALRFDSLQSHGWTNFTVHFPKPESDGYKYNFDFIYPSLVTSGAELSLHWSWGGASKSTPQTVKVKLPSGYDLDFVILNGIVSGNYASSVEAGRTTIDFKGIAPANGYFDWEIHYAKSTTATAAVRSTANEVTSTTITNGPNETNYARFLPGLWLVGPIGVIVVLGYYGYGIRIRNKFTCEQCGFPNPKNSSYCALCGESLTKDRTQVY